MRLMSGYEYCRSAKESRQHKISLDREELGRSIGEIVREIVSNKDLAKESQI